MADSGYLTIQPAAQAEHKSCLTLIKLLKHKPKQTYWETGAAKAEPKAQSTLLTHAQSENALHLARRISGWSLVAMLNFL